MAHALTLDLEPRLRALLAERIPGLQSEYGDLSEYTEFLIVEPGDTEADIVRHVGFSPLIDPFDGYRWPDPRFQPGWDHLADRAGWFELTVTFGSTFAYILLIADRHGVAPDLRALCRSFILYGTGGANEC